MASGTAEKQQHMLQPAEGEDRKRGADFLCRKPTSLLHWRAKHLKATDNRLDETVDKEKCRTMLPSLPEPGPGCSTPSAEDKAHGSGEMEVACSDPGAPDTADGRDVTSNAGDSCNLSVLNDEVPSTPLVCVERWRSGLLLAARAVSRNLENSAVQVWERSTHPRGKMCLWTNS